MNWPICFCGPISTEHVNHSKGSQVSHAEQLYGMIECHIDNLLCLLLNYRYVLNYVCSAGCSTETLHCHSAAGSLPDQTRHSTLHQCQVLLLPPHPSRVEQERVSNEVTACTTVYRRCFVCKIHPIISSSQDKLLY